MKVFVSGQLAEKGAVQNAYARIRALGMEITHDWTQTDDLVDYSSDVAEAGRRAALDIKGVLDCDLYVILTNNVRPGKGMYVELGAALALCELHGWPRVFVVGPRNHESIFYRHPAVRYFPDLEAWLRHVGNTSFSRVLETIG